MKENPKSNSGLLRVTIRPDKSLIEGSLKVAQKRSRRSVNGPLKDD